MPKVVLTTEDKRRAAMKSEFRKQDRLLRLSVS